MSKITFRADDELVEKLETFDASKSEVLREALRSYLEERPPGTNPAPRERDPDGVDASIDGLIRERVDALLADRLAESRPANGSSDVNVTIAFEDREMRATEPAVRTERSKESDTAHDAERQCGQCGHRVADDHVYCPNCGEKASRRLFCECGDELRSDWSFCPSCGRRTPAADVLDANPRRSRES